MPSLLNHPHKPQGWGRTRGGRGGRSGGGKTSPPSGKGGVASPGSSSQYTVNSTKCYDDNLNPLIHDEKEEQQQPWIQAGDKDI